ncbi:hypothetical protein ILUMI_04051 [Ignelater luminosus]|uniref:SUMO-activating enzyme subunit 1 n=1 Tax=Ignelater luminosus TaxID=2038154 RepID=A0A8K0GLK4_IGNLU|nr:hypothetical protein ILUMI_04051 [Ignelater luminosus]
MTEIELSTAEAELYDRQIRLWGIESQEKLRAANVLLIGVRGLGSEIAKNILLSGINSLTVLDNGIVTEEELQKNFLLNQESMGSNIAEAILTKAQALNPLVKLTTETEPVSEKPDKYFQTFTIVVATGLSSKQLVRIDSICRNSNVQFICGDVFGMFGYSLADFQEHEFYEDQVKLPTKTKRTHEGKPTETSEKTTVKIQRKLSYPPIDQVLPTSEKKIVKSGVPGKTKRCNELYYLMRLLIQFRDQNNRDPSFNSKEDDLKKLKEIREEIIHRYQVNEEKLREDVFNLIFGEVVPVCAVVGGVIAQEVIKAVSHKEVPIHNLFLLNPYNFCGKEQIVGA